MTKWQESCITALASSPFAWEAFKMKQRNKNLLWQYINRIWPYHRITSENIIVSEDTKMIEELKRLLTYLENYNISANMTYDFPRPIQFTITDTDEAVIRSLKLLPQSVMNICETNNFNCTLGGGDILSGRNNIINLLNMRTTGDDINFLCICGNMSEPENQIKNCIYGINLLMGAYKTIKGIKKSKKEPKKKVKNAINWLNIGIEIEHDASSKTSKKIQKRILQQNCTEYDSGYDGGMSSRLRENRIRLNGIKGLKGLYTLLQDMQENAAMARNSSVHMHVDCNFDDSYRNVTRKIHNSVDETRLSFSDIEQFFVDFILSNELLEEFIKIFNLNLAPSNDLTWDTLESINATNYIEAFEDWVNSAGIIRFNDEFNTIEYRFCIPNFNYSDYVIQILFLIHITECIKHNSVINKNYVKSLINVMNNLRNCS